MTLVGGLESRHQSGRAVVRCVSALVVELPGLFFGPGQLSRKFAALLDRTDSSTNQHRNEVRKPDDEVGHSPPATRQSRDATSLSEVAMTPAVLRSDSIPVPARS